MSEDQHKWVVLKFGGTSVSSLENWDNIARITNKRTEKGYRVCIVHSALKGVSQKLQLLLDEAPHKNVDNLVEDIEQVHRKLAEMLNLDADALLKDYFLELEKIVKGIGLVKEASLRVQARLMSLGELMATRLGAAYLEEKGIRVRWMDARNVLQAVPQKNAGKRSQVLSAVCESEPDEQLQKEFSLGNEILLTQGFIASDREGETVLLGRGGSDVSAAYVAAKLQAERLEIWTDVPGMFSANPHQVTSARLLTHLSYQEAQEIATNGAKVLHPRCILPARKSDIPIHIRCTENPDLEGTIISSTASDDEALVKAIAVRSNVILISLESLGMWQQVGFLADAFDIFKQFGLSIDLISTSESNVTVSLDPGLNAHFQEIREDFTEELGSICKVSVIESASAVSLLGRRIRTILHQLSPAFEVFLEHEVYLVSQAANDLNFTFVVASDQADRLVRQLHEEIISQSSHQDSFGPTWTELVKDDRKESSSITPWWESKKEQLLSLAHEQGPVYVYDRETLELNVKQLQNLEAVDKFFYAMKANANAGVLEAFHEMGMGFECVSIGEVEHVLKLFPDIDRDKILFTPNFAGREEYERALEHGIHLTLDNIYPLQEWPEVFAGQKLFLRIDPGHGHGHHKHVKTGGKHSKFGIPRFEIKEVKGLVEELEIDIRGLHAHIGSGIKDPMQWKDTAAILHEVSEELGGVEILDLGGGFGVRENENQTFLDMEKVNDSLVTFKKAHPEHTLWVEPGRFLVATAGVLLANVTQLKGKGEVRYVGVDTGMNSLIRPSLYGAHHTIVNLSKLEQPANKVVNIVGPICESGDKLGIDRLFPESEEGDVVLIANTGAYGRVMSSSYNLRMPAGEVVLDGR